MAAFSPDQVAIMRMPGCGVSLAPMPVIAPTQLRGGLLPSRTTDLRDAILKSETSYSEVWLYRWTA